MELNNTLLEKQSGTARGSLDSQEESMESSKLETEDKMQGPAFSVLNATDTGSQISTVGKMYRITVGKKSIGGIGYVNTYGITATEDSGKDRCTISDISTDKAFVESIVRVLNENSVSYVHFYDMVEDMIY